MDAYRGLVMVLMLAEVLHSCDVAAWSRTAFWRAVCFEQTHVAWTGCSLHDLIQPGFYFLVGVGLILSLRRRRAGLPKGALLRRALTRAVILVFLGMALEASHPRQWVWWFGDTLSQIGLGYPFLFLVALRPRRCWWIAFAGILVTYWLVFALYPVPASFDYAAVGVSPDWLQAHGLTGFAAHWQKGSNPAAAFDRWFLNLFPREASFSGSENGLTTLNFIPSIATMILGLTAGDVLISGRTQTGKVAWLCGMGAALMAIGAMLGAAGIAPVVKPIWSPGWVLFSGGWCCLFLAAFHFVEIQGGDRLAFPLTVVGRNSLVAYSLSHLFPAFAFNSLIRVFGVRTFEVFGSAYAPALYGAAVMVAYWLFLYMLYRRRIFVSL